MFLTRLKAILWLHTLRLWRYKWSFLNMVLSHAAWIFLFILGALLFVPGEYLGVAVKAAFWTIVAWNIISMFSSLIGGWMHFFISLGMVEEHILRGISPFKTVRQSYTKLFRRNRLAAIYSSHTQRSFQNKRSTSRGSAASHFRIPTISCGGASVRANHRSYIDEDEHTA